MRKATRTELESRNRELESDNSKLLRGLNDLADHKVEWIWSHREKDGCKYEYGISRLTSPSGPLMFIRFEKKGQNAYTSVHSFDDLVTSPVWDETGLHQAIAIGRDMILKANAAA